MSTIKQRELDLFYRYKLKKDKTAKKELLNSLYPILNQQISKFSTAGLPKTSLELEGLRLMNKAIETYDPNKSQLNTHVVNNLKKLSRFVSTYQNIGHIPEPRALLIGQYKSVYSNLYDEKGREPTTQEIADEMNLPVKEIERLQTELRKDLFISNIAEDEDEIGFFEFISPYEQTPAVKEAIEFVYFDATPTEKRVIEAYTGIYGKPKKKTKDLLAELGITESELYKIRKKLAKEIKELL